MNLRRETKDADKAPRRISRRETVVERKTTISKKGSVIAVDIVRTRTGVYTIRIYKESTLHLACNSFSAIEDAEEWVGRFLSRVSSGKDGIV